MHVSELDRLAAEVSMCTLCILHKSRVKAVPGEGPAPVDIMFVGEGPGFHENQQGRPFVGAAGQFLEELLASIGLKREQVYITNVVKCFISPRVPIYTSEGYRPVKDIRVGDLVLTHTGKFRPVVYVRPRETLPKGSPLVRLTIRSNGKGNSKPVSLMVTPEHPFLIDGEWKPAHQIRSGDSMKALGDRCEVCGETYFVRYDRYDARVYHTCSYRCHNRRIYHNPEAREKVRRSMRAQYAKGKRDPNVITARAHARTREMVAAGEAKAGRWTTEERGRSRVSVAQRVTEGRAGHRTGFGELELVSLLDRLGVEYVHHFAFPDSSLIYDVCLAHKKILIEVRGPGFNNQAAQERALLKDRLAADNGYLVVNLWWAQIVDQPEMVEAMLRRLLRNHAGEYVFVDVEVVAVEHRVSQRDFPLYNIGVEGDESYVAAGIVSHNCRPPGNRDPLPEEIEACEPYLDRQIALIRPKVIVTLGRFSMARAFPNEKISRIHGQPKKVDGIVYMPMYHPAAALHQPSLRETVEEDFRKLPEILAGLDLMQDEEPPEQAEQLSLF
jgi:uracil-DNA glycosylase family 4